MYCTAKQIRNQIVSEQLHNQHNTFMGGKHIIKQMNIKKKTINLPFWQLYEMKK